MTPLQPWPERQKSLGAKSIGCLDINLVDYVAILICHSYPNEDLRRSYLRGPLPINENFSSERQPRQTSAAYKVRD